MVTSRYIRLVLGLLVVLSAGGIASAQSSNYAKPQAPGRWFFLGTSQGDGGADHDRIHGGRERGRFQRVQIRVDRAPIESQRVVFHSANGCSKEVNIQHQTPAGGQTRAIDL